jgi:hypothetical protein
MISFDDSKAHGPFYQMSDKELEQRIEAIRQVQLEEELARVAAGEHPDDIAREMTEMLGDDHDLEF